MLEGGLGGGGSGGGGVRVWRGGGPGGGGSGSRTIYQTSHKRFNIIGLFVYLRIEIGRSIIFWEGGEVRRGRVMKFMAVEHMKNKLGTQLNTILYRW